MRADQGKQEMRGRELVLLAVLIAGVVGVIGLVLSDPSIDTSRVQPIPSAHAAARVPVAPAAVPVARPATPLQPHAVTPEENWAPDESSHGLRPDAAH